MAHSHRSGGGGDVRVGWFARVVLFAVLGAVGVLTVAGWFVYSPSRDEASAVRGSLSFAGEDVTFPRAEVVSVAPRCASLEEQPTPPLDEGACGTLTATVAEGEEAGDRTTVQVPPQVAEAGLGQGDHVELLRAPPSDDVPAQFSYFGIDRGEQLWLLVALFVIVTVAVAWWRGFMALLGLGFAGVVLAVFVIPGLLTGESPIPVAVVGATAIMFAVLYTTHGFSLRTSAALLGTLAGVALTGAIGAWSVESTHLTGVTDEGGAILSSELPSLELQGLLTAAVIIAGLGALNDVTITQASAVWELRGASPSMSRRRLFASAMRIGRDHVASTIYTIVFACAGTALTLLLVVSLYDRSLASLVETEEIATEVVRSLVSAVGLILAMPLTTGLASVLVSQPTHPDSAEVAV